MWFPFEPSATMARLPGGGISRTPAHAEKVGVMRVSMSCIVRSLRGGVAKGMRGL